MIGSYVRFGQGPVTTTSRKDTAFGIICYYRGERVLRENAYNTMWYGTTENHLCGIEAIPGLEEMQDARRADIIHALQGELSGLSETEATFVYDKMIAGRNSARPA